MWKLQCRANARPYKDLSSGAAVNLFFKRNTSILAEDNRRPES